MQPGTDQISRLASTIRSNFVGVWTSFPFLAVHFAEVGIVNGLPSGVLFVVLSMVAAATSFEVCRWATEELLSGKQPTWAKSISGRTGRIRLTVGLGIFVATMVLSSSMYLQSTLFANVPAGPAVDDGLRLLLRMGFAVGGAVTASFVGGPPSRINAASCIFVGLAYGAARIYNYDPSTGSLRVKMAFDMFVGTFCGTFSSFPEIFSTTKGLWKGTSKGKQREREVVEVSTNVLVALFFGGLYYAGRTKGWDVASHSFLEQ